MAVAAMPGLCTSTYGLWDDLQKTWQAEHPEDVPWAKDLLIEVDYVINSVRLVLLLCDIDGATVARQVVVPMETLYGYDGVPGPELIYKILTHTWNEYTCPDGPELTYGTANGIAWALEFLETTFGTHNPIAPVGNSSILSVSSSATDHGGTVVANTVKELRQELKVSGRKAAIWIQVRDVSGTVVGTFVEERRQYLLDAIKMFPDTCVVPYEVENDTVYVRCQFPAGV